MAISKDRVRFTLASRYFQGNTSPNGMLKETCKTILLKAFCMTHSESEERMFNQAHGFEIICRPSQFARFIIFRHEMGNCINGVRDLEPELIEVPDMYAEIADATGVDREAVRRVLNEVGYKGKRELGPIDVSNRHGDKG